MVVFNGFLILEKQQYIMVDGLIDIVDWMVEIFWEMMEEVNEKVCNKCHYFL